jgi:hypothetical protein
LLKRFFIVSVSSTEEAEKTIDRLKKCEGVEAAYVKPAGSHP